MANFTKIRSIRDYLSREACTTLVLMLCITHIDYANAIPFGSTARVINKFQSLQNMCAKLILRRPKTEAQWNLSKNYTGCQYIKG